MKREKLSLSIKILPLYKRAGHSAYSVLQTDTAEGKEDLIIRQRVALENILQKE